VALGAISVARTTSDVEEAARMNPEETQTDELVTPLMTEDLIEEISIDGMCGVY
jgi:mycofactocin precursor